MRSMRGAYSFFFSPSPSFFGGALSGSAFSLPEVGSCRRSLSFLVVRPPYCESGGAGLRSAGGRGDATALAARGVRRRVEGGGEAADGFEAAAYVVLGLRRRRGREAEEGRARDRRDVATRHHRRLAATRVHHDAAGGGRREASGSSSCARNRRHSVEGSGVLEAAWRPHQGTASKLIRSTKS